MEPKYKRVLLKISGEALAGEQGTGINMEVTATVADQIKKLIDVVPRNIMIEYKGKPTGHPMDFYLLSKGKFHQVLFR